MITCNLFNGCICMVIFPKGKQSSAYFQEENCKKSESIAPYQ